jgi:hypothetical protein
MQQSQSVADSVVQLWGMPWNADSVVQLWGMPWNADSVVQLWGMPWNADSVVQSLWGMQWNADRKRYVRTIVTLLDNRARCGGWSGGCAACWLAPLGLRGRHHRVSSGFNLVWILRVISPQDKVIVMWV